MSHKPLSDRIRKAALGPTPDDDDSLTGWFGYYTEPWVLVMARLPDNGGWPRQEWWFCATDTERRMFLLFVAEALEQP